MSDTVSHSSRRVPLGDLRFLVIGEIRRLLMEEKQAVELAQSADFVSREQARLIRRRSINDALLEFETLVDSTVAAFPQMSNRARQAHILARNAATARSGQEMRSLIGEIIDLFEQPPSSQSPLPVTITGDDQGIVFGIGGTPDPVASSATTISDSLARSRIDQAFLAAVCQMIDKARLAGRKLSGTEQFVRAAAFQALEAGAAPPPAYIGIGISGFRRYQTSLSLADPGEGHNLVTCLDSRLLAGTVVHVEHIDRGKQTDREIVEAYRLPAPLNAARVRLQVGTAAPCTAYIGRPPFENGASPDPATKVVMAREFEEDLLKAAHMTASACTVMFSHGIADCKVAIERMSVTQLVRFMEAIAGNVLRDRSRQFLSAAFNLNVPLLDDRGTGTPHWVNTKWEIARLAIEITVAGGFEKVTWDGASNLATSEPVITTFTNAQWLELIHLAHEQGLETYVSAGMDERHMPACVYSGVDGVGIGTSLHYRKRDANGKYVMGELKPAAILEVLKTRDTAARSARGRGADMLAMLDRLHYESILPEECEALRTQLFSALSIEQPVDGSIERILVEVESHEYLAAMLEHRARGYDLHPVLAQAQRQIIAGQGRSAILELGAIRARRFGGALPGATVEERLREAMGRDDITEIMEILR
ncbi:hypothetical protein [Massilia sp. BKSP1R2A-1]|uniref:hypothetical protein n=1 Tax=Massilia sp. BKSP1R2A-1 TaxID=3422595 RepID=UPI003D332804